MQEEQSAVTRPDEQVTVSTVPPASEVTNAQDDVNLDALLNEWSEKVEEPSATVDPVQTSQSNQETAPINDDRIAKLLEFVEIQKSQVEFSERKQAEKEYKDTVKALKGNLPVSEKVIDGYLQASAQSDQRIAKAYQNRHKNPALWEKTMKGLQDGLRKELGTMPDKAVTETRNAVTAAIQSANSVTNNPVGKPVHEMSQREFDKYWDSL